MKITVADFVRFALGCSAYQHGEGSLMSTIIGLAQDYVGSNNINLLLPLGHFGTRLHVRIFYLFVFIFLHELKPFTCFLREEKMLPTLVIFSQ